MKKISFALLASTLFASIAFAQAQDDLSAIKSSGVIKIGTEGTYALILIMINQANSLVLM